MSRRWADPNERARLGKAISAAVTPEERQRRRERGKISCNARAAAAGGEARRKAGLTLSRQKLPWLPLEYRADYFYLRNIHKMRAPEAREVIEAQIARDLQRYAATGVLPQTSRGHS